MSDVQAQVRRFQASSLATAEFSEAGTWRTEYASENGDFRDLEATSLKETDNLRQQFVDLHMERSRL